MKKFTDFVCKNNKLILIIAIILLMFSFIGIKTTKINYDILVYLPENIETIKGQNILTDDFDMGSYSIVVAENMSSKDIIKLEDKIKDVEGVNQVVSIYDLIGTSIPLEVLPNDLTSYLHQDDTDILLITFSGSTSSEITIDAVKKIRSIASNDVKLGGMSSMVLDTMELSQKEIFIYIVIAVALCILVLELSLDSYLIPILLLLNIGCAIVYNLGTNVFLGHISYITKALAAVLQLGVTTDFSIFLYHSYESKKEKAKNKKDAMKEAIIETFTSISGSSLTTIAGFLVLCAMQLTLGKDLGIVMAKGVLLGVISVLTLFPALLLTFDNAIEKAKHKSLKIDFSKLNEFIVKKHVAIIIIFLILIIPCYLGYKKIDVYYKMDKSLPETLESISANTILKDKFNIVSPEIILLDKDMKTEDVTLMTNELKEIDGVDFILSFEELKSLGISENMLPSDLLKLFKNDKYEMMLLNSEYEVASDELNAQVTEINKIVKKYDKNSIVAGEGPLMKDLITTSDTDFNNVNTYSIVCIFIILLIVLKSFSLPFLLILTIESAIIINMSVSYFTGTTLPFVAPIVLGTIQLGATIDYAILLTSSYLNNRQNNMKPKEAMISTLNYNGVSVLISGLCFFAATFGVGIYSQIDMVASLCTLISRGAIISMLVVITILPSILIIFDKLIIKFAKGMKNMKKNKQKLAASFLLMLTLVYPFNVLALTKEETVYAKLNSDGSSKKVTVNEHLINTEKSDSIADYSNLKDIINLNGNETFTQTNEIISWDAKKNDIFYQGKYENALPVTLNATYKLNGTETVIKDMLGKSGSVEITLKYTNNDKHYVKVNGRYEELYTPFTVAFLTTFDSTKTSNLSITNGEISSNGTKEMALAIATPGLYESLKLNELQGMDEIKITFDTTSFELPTMYSVISPKILSANDLSIFDKLNELYAKSNDLSTNMDTINNGANDLLAGSNKLKSGLEQAIIALDATKEDENVLTEENISEITNSATTIIESTFTKEYEETLANSTWEKVQASLANNTEEQAKVQAIVVEYLTKTGELGTYQTCEIAKKTAEATETEMSEAGKAACMTIASDNVLTYITTAATATAETVTKQVAPLVAKETALTTAKTIAPVLSSTVALETRNKTIDTVEESLKLLTDGVTTLDEGIASLATGITKYNEEGIKQISNLVNGTVRTNASKLKALQELGKEYQTVNETSIGTDSSTKFILVIDGEKVAKKTTKTTETKAKQTFIDRVKNLFN